MVSTAPAPVQQQAKVVLQGVHWATFKALMQDLEGDYQIFYGSEWLEITRSLTDANDAATHKITLNGIQWETYRTLMEDVGDARAWRIAYTEGALEIRMPLLAHEEPKELLGAFVNAIADELEIEVRQLGALTLKREDLRKAIEPDTCFYIQNESQVRAKEALEFPQDPPPDLAIESDNTRSSINKFGLYASLGVPELWRYRKKKLEIYHLIDSTYQRYPQSLAFPFLPVDEVPQFIERSREVGQRSAVRLLRERIREILQNQ